MAIIKPETLKDALVMHLMKYLFFFYCPPPDNTVAQTPAGKRKHSS